MNDSMLPAETAVSPATPVESAPTPPAEPPQKARRHRYLLQQLAEAPGQQLTQTEANKRIPRAIKRDLDLDSADAANHVRAELADQQYLRVEKQERTVLLHLTEQGQAYLQTLPPYEGPPLRRMIAARQVTRPRGKIIEPTTEEIARYRKSYMLLQLVQAEGHTLPKKEADKFEGKIRERLDLNAATAQHVREQLAAEGLLRLTEGAYTLTEAGRLQLGARGLDDTEYTFSLTGKALNQLLEAARDAAKQFEGAAATPAQAQPLVDLAQAVLDEFEDLRRELYQHSGMVPIHEVRQRIRARYGDEAARHDVLDEVLLGLWRNGRLRLASISDQERATPEQLQDSIPGDGETLFYLEAAHEPAVL